MNYVNATPENAAKIQSYADSFIIPCAHAYISPSGLHKSLHCPASPGREFLVERRREFLRAMGQENPTVQAILERDEEAASDGTLCHQLYEQYCSPLLEKYDDPDKERAALQSAVEEEITQYASDRLTEDARFIDEFVSVIWETRRMLANASWHLKEQKVYLAKYAMWGTVDLVFQTGSTLHVWDLKTGRQEVKAEANEQLSAYTIGLLDALDWKGIDSLQLAIIGIRFRVDVWNTTLQAMRTFRDEVLEPGLLEAYKLGAKGNPGDCCMYCKAKLWCPEFNAQIKYIHDKGEFGVEGKGFEELDNTELVDRFLLSKQIEKFQQDAKDEIALRYEGFGNMEQEQRVKYVRPTPIAEFVDEESAAEELAEMLDEGQVKHFVKKKAVNPTRLKGLLSSEDYDRLVVEKPRKPYVKMA